MWDMIKQYGKYLNNQNYSSNRHIACKRYSSPLYFPLLYPIILTASLECFLKNSLFFHSCLDFEPIVLNWFKTFTSILCPIKILWGVFYLMHKICTHKTFVSFSRSIWLWKVNILNQFRTSRWPYSSTLRDTYRRGLPEVLQKVVTRMGCVWSGTGWLEGIVSFTWYKHSLYY